MQVGRKKSSGARRGYTPAGIIAEAALGFAMAAAGVYLMVTGVFELVRPPIGAIAQFGEVSGGVDAGAYRAPARLLSPGTAAGAGCEMSLADMLRSRGSLLLYGTDGNGGFLVHWSGGETSRTANCGSDADLRIGGRDLVPLFAAGNRLGRLPAPR